METKINELIQKHPNLTYVLRSPRFQAMSQDAQDYIFELIEDAEFWLTADQEGQSDGGFKFLASTFGLSRAQKEAKEKGMTGKEREQHLQPHQELYTQFNPYSGRTSDR